MKMPYMTIVQCTLSWPSRISLSIFSQAVTKQCLSFLTVRGECRNGKEYGSYYIIGAVIRVYIYREISMDYYMAIFY